MNSDHPALPPNESTAEDDGPQPSAFSLQPSEDGGPHPSSLIPHPFDGMAADYDDSFTHSAVGCLMRAAVWERLDALFQPGQRVIELSCGTGEDAAHLAARGVRVLATDISSGMLAATRAKVASRELDALVEVAQLDLARLAEWGRTIDRETGRPGEAGLVSRSPGLPPSLSPGLPPSLSPGLPIPQSPNLPISQSPPFDGALSNFGGLNCVADLRGVAAGLASLLRPGAPAVLCVMGPLVPWEWGWYLRRGEAGKAIRRLRPGGVAWRGLTITYPSVGALRRAFAPWFRFRRVAAVGALVPPSYAEPWAAAHPVALWALHRIEQHYAATPPLPQLADHYLLELDRL